MRLFYLISLIALSTLPSSQAAVVKCNFEVYDFYFDNHVPYQCAVENDLFINTTENAVIESVEGEHHDGKSNDDVQKFKAGDERGREIALFPRNLHLFFKNLKKIHIWYGRITEIHQSDLKPFDKLERLSLTENDIEVLEEGLFDFNPKLNYVSFSNNKIRLINPQIFDNLNHLEHINLGKNECMDLETRDADRPSEMKKFVKVIKNNCRIPLIEQVLAKIENIENILKALADKIDALEKKQG